MSFRWIGAVVAFAACGPDVPAYHSEAGPSDAMADTAALDATTPPDGRDGAPWIMCDGIEGALTCPVEQPYCCAIPCLHCAPPHCEVDPSPGTLADYCVESPPPHSTESCSPDNFPNGCAGAADHCCVYQPALPTLLTYCVDHALVGEEEWRCD